MREGKPRERAAQESVSPMRLPPGLLDGDQHATVPAPSEGDQARAEKDRLQSSHWSTSEHTQALDSVWASRDISPYLFGRISNGQLQRTRSCEHS